MKQDSIIKPDEFVSLLQSKKGDKGYLACLKAGLRPASAYRSYPIFGRLGALGDERKARIIRLIGGLFGLYPEHSTSTSIGMAFRRFCSNDECKNLGGMTVGPVERRFQRFLAADKESIFEQVEQFVRRAKSNGIPVNYLDLADVLQKWSYEDGKRHASKKLAHDFWTTREERYEENA